MIVTFHSGVAITLGTSSCNVFSCKKYFFLGTKPGRLAIISDFGPLECRAIEHVVGRSDEQAPNPCVPCIVLESRWT